MKDASDIDRISHADLLDFLKIALPAPSSGSRRV
jgi:hypothetical protein